MKKLITVLLLLMLTLTACGGGQTSGTSSSSSGSDAKAEESIDGKWKSTENEDDPYYLYIDGDTAVMDFYGETYKGRVSTEFKTISFDNGEEFDATIFDYELVAGALVLTIDPAINEGREEASYTYVKAEE